MRKELDEKLCADFPRLFRDRHAPMNQTCMCWGFECGDGWFDLIYKLCQDLTKIKDDVTALQVKEKFGGLRFYVGFTATNEQLRLIDAAEEASYTICEVCGEPGKTRGGGWIKTLCDKHEEERQRAKVAK